MSSSTLARLNSNKRSNARLIARIQSTIPPMSASQKTRSARNLPPVTHELLGKNLTVVKLDIGRTGGFLFDCAYQYRVISPRNNLISRLIDGWNKVMDFLAIQQGDVVVFKSDVVDVFKFHVYLQKDAAVVKVEEGVWI
ncbi:hypothetical protein C2S52_007380 [Perilla frutescens var. hirtella]|nr:hypothetical protein C2S51_008499 [Perilla frutescens var. frutescens]KAH6787828.1 hypothetical protein C2S52_007380 [Perilla frutescens var. hirtella]